MAFVSSEDCKKWRCLLQEVKQMGNPAASVVTKSDVEEQRRLELITKAKKLLQESQSSQTTTNPIASIAAQILYRLNEWTFDHTKHANDLPLISAFLNSADVNWEAYLQFLSVDLVALEFLNSLVIQEVLCSVKSNWTKLTHSIAKEDVKKIVDRILQLWHLGMHLETSNLVTKAIANGMVGLYRRMETKFGELAEVFVLRLPHYVKFKYVFLPHVLDSADESELSPSLLITCYKQVEKCLECQHLASVTPNTILSLAIKYQAKDRLEEFLQLVLGTMTDSRRVVRTNCCRHWLPKLFTNHQLGFNVFRLLNASLLERLRPQHASTSNDNCNDSARVNSHLWWHQETLLWAWINPYKYLVRFKAYESTEREEETRLLRCALCSRQNAIKLLAVEVLQQFMEENRQNVLHLLQPMEDAFRFVLANYGTDDVDVRNSVISLFTQLPGDSSGRRLNKLMEWVHPTNRSASTSSCTNIERTLTALKLMMLDIDNTVKSADLWSPPLLELLSNDEEQSVRTTSLQLLMRCVDSCGEVGKQKLADEAERLLWTEVDQGRLRLISLNLYELLLKLGRDEDMSIARVECGEDIQITMASLRAKYGFMDGPALVGECLATNEKLLRLGGSSGLGVCQPAYQLNHYMNGAETLCCDEEIDGADEHGELLMSSEKEKGVLSRYGDGLIHSCDALSALSNGLDSAELKECARSIWGVLLRSHHRGVLEHCSQAFDGLIKQLVSNEDTYKYPMEVILQETMSLIRQAHCQSRDIGFSKILLSICTHHPDECEKTLLELIEIYREVKERSVQLRVLHILQRFLLSSSFDLSQIHAPICEFLLQNCATTDWKLFSLICSAFAALINALFRRQPAKIPLANFLNSNSSVLELILAKLIQLGEQSSTTRRSETFLPLLLAPLERLVSVGFPFDSKRSLRFAQRLFPPLRNLFLLEPALVVRRQIMEILVNLIGPEKHDKVIQIAERLGSCNGGFGGDVLWTVASAVESHYLNELTCQVKPSSQRSEPNYPALGCALPDPQTIHSKNVMSRIKAAKLLVTVAPQLSTQPTPQILQFNTYFCLLMTDEVEEIRLIIAQCSAALRSAFPTDPYNSILSVTKHLLCVGNNEVTGKRLLEHWTSFGYGRRRYAKYLSDDMISELLLLSFCSDVSDDKSCC